VIGLGFVARAIAIAHERAIVLNVYYHS